jgi:HK97 family phage portal protein
MLMGMGGWVSTLLESWNSTNKNGSTRVTEAAALSYPPAWYAVNKISGHIAQMPLVVKRRVDDGAETDKDHPAYRVLKTRPNTYQTAAVFKSQLMMHYLLWGNARAAIYRSGDSIELLPLLPYDTVTVWDEGEKWHVTKLFRDDRISLLEDFLGNPQANVSFRDEDVLHMPWVTSNGIDGVGVLQAGKRALAMGIDAEKHVSNSLSKGFTGRILLQAPTGVFRKEDDAREFLENFKKDHKGPEGNEIGMLREGIVANLLQSSARDNQLIEQRVFQRQDAALLFMLESIIGDDSSVSYNSLEQKHLAYLVNCLGPILVRWEEECNEKLLSEEEKRSDSHYCKFNTGALLRTDYPTTIDTLSKALQSRIITRNEAREKIDMNTVEGGDDFENPNIDKLQSSSDTPDPSDDDSGDDTGDDVAPQQSNRADAIRGRLQHMLGVESKRVKNATSSNDYIAWADRFYSRWSSTFGDVIGELGGDEMLAESYCSKHKSEILKVYDVATADTFLQEIEQVTSGWSVESIVKSILEDLGDV